MSFLKILIPLTESDLLNFDERKIISCSLQSTNSETLFKIDIEVLVNEHFTKIKISTVQNMNYHLEATLHEVKHFAYYSLMNPNKQVEMECDTRDFKRTLKEQKCFSLSVIIFEIFGEADDTFLLDSPKCKPCPLLENFLKLAKLSKNKNKDIKAICGTCGFAAGLWLVSYHCEIKHGRNMSSSVLEFATVNFPKGTNLTISEHLSIPKSLEIEVIVFPLDPLPSTEKIHQQSNCHICLQDGSFCSSPIFQESLQSSAKEYIAAFELLKLNKECKTRINTTVIPIRVIPGQYKKKSPTPTGAAMIPEKSSYEKHTVDDNRITPPLKRKRVSLQHESRNFKNDDNKSESKTTALGIEDSSYEVITIDESDGEYFESNDTRIMNERATDRGNSATTVGASVVGKNNFITSKKTAAMLKKVSSLLKRKITSSSSSGASRANSVSSFQSTVLSDQGTTIDQVFVEECNTQEVVTIDNSTQHVLLPTEISSNIDGNSLTEKDFQSLRITNPRRESPAKAQKFKSQTDAKIRQEKCLTTVLEESCEKLLSHDNLVTSGNYLDNHIRTTHSDISEAVSGNDLLPSQAGSKIVHNNLQEKVLTTYSEDSKAKINENGLVAPINVKFGNIAADNTISCGENIPASKKKKQRHPSVVNCCLCNYASINDKDLNNHFETIHSELIEAVEEISKISEDKYIAADANAANTVIKLDAIVKIIVSSTNVQRDNTFNSSVEEHLERSKTETSIILDAISKGLYSTSALIQNIIVKCNTCHYSTSLCKIINHYKNHSTASNCEEHKINYNHPFKTGCFCHETSSIKEFLVTRRIEQAVLDELKVGNLLPLKSGINLDSCAIKCKLCGLKETIFNMVHHVAKEHRRDTSLYYGFYNEKLKPQFSGAEFNFSESMQYIKHIIFSSLPQKLLVNYKCFICHKTAFQKSDLKRHLNAVHAKVKNHACLLCGKKFSQHSDVKRHQKTVHLKRKEFQCNICKKLFGQAATMKKHLEDIHNISPK